jgi:hypothetical protein
MCAISAPGFRIYYSDNLNARRYVVGKKLRLHDGYVGPAVKFERCQSPGYLKGWDNYEEHSQITDAGVAGYCSLLPPHFESTNLQVSYDRKTFYQTWHQRGPGVPAIQRDLRFTI